MIKELDYRNTTDCPTGKEVCRQMAAYLWPLYCSMKKHLECEGAGCETMQFQLELLYAVSYGLQMVNKRTQLLLRCEPRHQYFRHTDVRKELLEADTRINPGDVFAPSRRDFCDRTNDLFYNLYADRDDPQFSGCQREKRPDEYHRKFEWMGEVGHWRSEMEVIRFLAFYLD
ncbi:hypothetical protein M3Y99_00267100 [Aphelenchoides fujianensis]|nr:hypothetical protein M3Y99_00267100 [Aphelenchoides fujianensis]